MPLHPRFPVGHGRTASAFALLPLLALAPAAHAQDDVSGVDTPDPAAAPAALSTPAAPATPTRRAPYATPGATPAPGARRPQAAPMAPATGAPATGTPAAGTPTSTAPGAPTPAVGGAPSDPAPAAPESPSSAEAAEAPDQSNDVSDSPGVAPLAASFEFHGGARFVEEGDEEILGTPALVGFSLSGWYATARRVQIGVSLGVDVSFSSEDLPATAQRSGSEAASYAVDVPVLAHGAWRAAKWLRVVLGVGAAWRHQQLFIDNPKGAGDDLVRSNGIALASRLAVEVPFRVGTLECAPFLAVGYLGGARADSRRLRYSNRDFTLGGSETSVALGFQTTLFPGAAAAASETR